MKILYVKNGNSTFIKLDQEILEKYFPLITFKIDSSRRFWYVVSLIKLFFFLVFRLHPIDIVFTRFADYHTALLSFFCIRYKKKLIIVVGGYDVAYMPEYNYGAFTKKFRGWCVRYSLRNADYILPNNPRLIEYNNTYAFHESRKGGIKHFVPDVKGIIKVIYNGYKTDFWKYDQNQPKEDMALTVAYIRDYRFYRLKGIDDFIKVASLLYEYKFVIIGLSAEKARKLKISVPENLVLIPELSQEELRIFYQKAKVFCLFSVTEGMPNVLCEAMLCNCIPVCSDVTFMREIVNDTGFINKRKDINEIKHNVLKAFKAEIEMGIKARKRIEDNYSINKREQELVKLIESIQSLF